MSWCFVIKAKLNLQPWNLVSFYNVHEHFPSITFELLQGWIQVVFEYLLTTWLNPQPHDSCHWSCKPILNIYASIVFQLYRRLFIPMGFGPCNCVLKIQESICVGTLTLGLRPRQGVIRLRAKKKTRESHHTLPRMPKNVREWTLTFQRELPCWEFESQMDSWIFRTQLQGSKPISLESFLYYWKDIESWMSKIGSHRPFGHL